MLNFLEKSMLSILKNFGFSQIVLILEANNWVSNTDLLYKFGIYPQEVALHARFYLNI